jgi:succinyl-diaminopimelate desuccinylase
MARIIGREIRKYQDEMLEDIVKLVSIQSAQGAPLKDMPYGEGPTKALKFCLELAESFGLKTKNVDNRAGHIEYGEGDGLAAVLAHVDVVPAGEGWSVPPYGDTVRGGRIYGRGTMDDKGPAIAAIYCLKTLKDLGIEPKRRIRVILGASEETGSDDMKYYFRHEELPDLAFTPDGDYPICSMEKGILRIKLTGRPEDNGEAVSFVAGSAVNMVPVTAQAVLRCPQAQADEMEKAAAGLEKSGARLVTDRNESGCEIRCLGRAAHASTPDEGINAASYLIRLISGVSGSGLIKYLNDTVGLGSDGAGMGVACSDVSGALTLNLGIVDVSGDKCEAILDIRYPVTMKGADIASAIAASAEKYGVRAETMGETVPLNISEDSELIRRLKSAYRNATGKNAKCYATGGGSYARELEGRGVAFGAGVRPLSYYRIHAADEFLDIGDFMRHCEICLQAVCELGCE